MALLAPPFVAPCYMLYETWGALSVAQWHPVFKLLAEIGEVYALFAGLWVMYKRIPQFWCALTSAIIWDFAMVAFYTGWEPMMRGFAGSG